jgi:hypothetical protein
MAQYPQGVTDFIPDYQAYQPDFNFSANVLQLKQTQYDQNWSRLNNIYGQILNAPLTHQESTKRRDNTLKRIDFDLKRITGLDLSLEQNVQQATQLFRPFYEDSNLMYDMAWTKNTSREKSIGTGKRYATDKETRDEAWDGGLRAIDYKIEEFKTTPYDQISSVGQVRFTPYANVEKMALELANKLKYKVKKTTPQGDWIVTEQNGEQIVGPLQSIFYSVIGKDPKVQEFYQTQSYLDRKDWINANKDRPDYKGSPEAAEKSYLNGTLKMLQKQTELTRSTIVDQKRVNDNMISTIEKSIANGTASQNAEASLKKYQDANSKLDEMLAKVDDDYSLINDNVNKTLSTVGGTKLDLDDVNQMRSRVDNVLASTALQADLDKSVRDYAYQNYELSYDPNPFAVQRQKFQYDSALISQRIAGQKDVAAFKHGLKLEEIGYKAKVDSGYYELDPISGKLTPKAELTDVFSMGDIASFTTNDEEGNVKIDRSKLAEKLQNLKKQEGESVKTNLLATIDKMMQNGDLSQAEVNQIFGGQQGEFNMKPYNDWLKGMKKMFGIANVEQDMGIPKKQREQLLEQGMYETSLEKENRLVGLPDKEGKLVKGADTESDISSRILRAAGIAGSFDNVSPEYLKKVTENLMAVVGKKAEDPKLRNIPELQELRTYSRNIQDYAAYKEIDFEARKKNAKMITQKLEAQGFKYAKYLFDENYDMVTDDKQFVLNIADNAPELLEFDNGLSFRGLLNAAILGLSSGATVGAFFGGVGAAPGSALGTLLSSGSYVLSGAGEGIYNALFNKNAAGRMRLVGDKTDWKGDFRDVADYYSSLSTLRDDIVTNVPLEIPGVSGGTGSDTYTLGGSGIVIQPGVASPTYQHFLQVKGALNKLNLNADMPNSYVSFDGVNKPIDDLSEETITGNASAFQAIWSDLISKSGGKFDEKLKQFIVGVSPQAGGRGDKAAVVLKLPTEYLKQWEPTADNKKIWSQDSDYYKALQNGITVITDAKNLASVSLYRNSFKTTEQIRIEKAGGDGVTYTDPLYPGYSINYSIPAYASDKMTAKVSYPQYQGPGLAPKIVTMTETLANQGINLVKFRENFFTDQTRIGQTTAGELMQQNLNNMNAYGR